MDAVFPIRPSREEVLSHRGSETHMAVSLEAIADAVTPISLYRKLAQSHAHSFLLESAEGGETVGRYSFIGFAPDLVVELNAGVGTIRGDGEKSR